MTTLQDLSRDEKSLLLYLETQCVDYGGSFEQIRLNDEDRSILERWQTEGFISYGRICSQDWPTKTRYYWATLSEQAWSLAHEERRARFQRMYERRPWSTTQELSEEAVA